MYLPCSFVTTKERNKARLDTSLWPSFSFPVAKFTIHRVVRSEIVSILLALVRSAERADRKSKQAQAYVVLFINQADCLTACLASLHVQVASMDLVLQVQKPTIGI